METHIYDFFRQYSTSPANANLIGHEFHCFKGQLSPFEAACGCWSSANNPKLFWHTAAINTEAIGELALRIWSTPVNSAASERAFSIQNLIHTITHNRLQSEQADKLVYTYTNGWV